MAAPGSGARSGKTILDIKTRPSPKSQSLLVTVLAFLFKVSEPMSGACVTAYRKCNTHTSRWIADGDCRDGGEADP